jgi:hypothetical protein
VRNFLVKAKDLYFSDPETFRSFSEVLKVAHDLSRIKNYFVSDLFDIEEILSILEMQEQFEGRALGDSFKNFIVDVIEAYTP